MSRSVADRLTSSGTVTRPTRVRWIVVVVLFVFYTVNCIDRMSLSVAMPSITEDFGLSATVQGIILSAFFWTYCLCQIPGGMAADRFGPRKVIGVAAAIWGFFTASAGFALNGVMLVLSRIGLGAFEAPYMPSASKLVSKWLPEKRRATGVTLIDSGAPLGSALGGLLIAALISATGSWRWSFMIVGGATILLGLAVYAYIRNTPEEHPSVNQAEIDLIRTVAEPAVQQEEKPGLTPKNITAIVIGRMGWAMVFWGLVTWGPSYLANARGLDLKAMGFATFLIFLCGAAGEISSGFIADKLQTLISRNAAFKVLFGGSGLLSLLALVALPFVDTATSAVTLLCVGVFFNLFGGLYWTLPGMLAKPDKVGFVGGVMNFAGTSSGIIVPIVAGILLDVTGGYDAVLAYLAICAAVYLVGSLSINFNGSSRKAAASNA